MRLTGGMQPKRSALDVRVDPSLLAGGASADDIGEGGVAGDGKLIATDPPGKRARRAEAAQRKDRAGPWLDPENLVGIAAISHREDTGGITAKQNPGVEAAHRATLQYFADDVLRAAQAHTLAGLDQRPVDEDRVRDHRVEDRIATGVS